MVLLGAAALILFAWGIAMCTRKLLDASGRLPTAWPTWVRHFAYGIGTRSVLIWGLALFALLPFELILLSILETTEPILLLWLSWLYLGLILISPKKVPVVFLRRFGLTRSNDITRKAFSRHLRGGFRLLTLDDRKFTAVPFRLRDAGATLSVAVLIGISFVTASQASCQRGINAQEQNDVNVSFGEQIVYEAFRSANTALVTLATTVATAGLVIAIALVWWSRHTVAIGRASELFRLSWLARRLRNRFWSPSLNPTIVVTSVAHEEWQGAVRTLVHTGAPVLVDVSRPGEGLLWEIAELAKSNLPMTLIAETRELRQWQHDRHNQQAQQLSAALGDRAILEYDASRSSSARDLARALRLALPASGRSRFSFRFAALASIAFFIYLVITIEVMPWPEPAADWVNDMSRRYSGRMLIY